MRRVGVRGVDWTTYSMYTVLYRVAPGQGDRVDRPPWGGGVHAAQPLWLVMMINAGKCQSGVCATAQGLLPLSTAQQAGGRLQSKMGNMGRWREPAGAHMTRYTVQE